MHLLWPFFFFFFNFQITQALPVPFLFCALTSPISEYLPWSFPESWANCKLFFNISWNVRSTSWNCVIRQGDSCCAYHQSKLTPFFLQWGVGAPLLPTVSCTEPSARCFKWYHWCLIVCTCSIYYTFSSWWFLSFRISESASLSGFPFFLA